MNKRPRGRAPNGQTWDAEKGAWVNEDGTQAKRSKVEGGDGELGEEKEFILELGTSKFEMQSMDFTMTQEHFLAHPLTKREIQVWTEHNWAFVSYEPGETCKQAMVNIKCKNNHPKALGVEWYLNGVAGFGRPAVFDCTFCKDSSKVVKGFLEYKRNDYVRFAVNPGIGFEWAIGRVEKINKKSIRVVTLNQQRHAVMNTKHLKPALPIEEEGYPEIPIIRKQRSIADKLR